jgi:ElaB/YqjD/DUF883 family membrane-anchored ribosome-binding protein
MPTKSVAKRPRTRKTTVARRPRVTMSREARAAYGEIQSGVKSLERAIADVRRGLAKAEKQIEADARQRVRELRKEAQTQLGVLQAKRRDAARTLKSLSVAAGESWQDIKSSADSVLADARATAATIVERFRGAIGR